MKYTIAFFTLAYNAEASIRQTIESVLSQSIQDWVYYIRDNGSTDGTSEILQKYANDDPRIIIFRNEINGEYGNSEPYGFPKPNARYITILDSDDLIEKRYAEELILNADRHHAEIAICGSKAFYDGVINEFFQVNNLSNALYMNGSPDIMNNLDKLYAILRVFWAKVFDTEFFYKYYYDESYTEISKFRNGFDTAVTLSLCMHATKIVTIDKVLHLQRVRRYSNYRDARPSYSRTFDCVPIYHLGLKFVKKYSIVSNKHIQFFQSVVRGHLLDLEQIVMDSKLDIIEKAAFFESIVMDPRYVAVQEIIGYDGFINQFKQLIHYLVRHIEDIENHISYALYLYLISKSDSAEYIDRKLFLILSVYDVNNINRFGINELNRWESERQIPKWYFKFCSQDTLTQYNMVQDHYSFIELVNGDFDRSTLDLYLQEIETLAKYQRGDALDILEVLVSQYPLVFEFLILHYKLALNESQAHYLSSWLKLLTFYSDKEEVVSLMPAH